MSIRSSLTLLIVVLLIQALPTCSRAGEPAEGGALAFETEIRAILRAHCFDCHGATEEIEGELDLRLVRFMIRGGQSGPAIHPGDAASSLLIERVSSGEMPPGEQKVSPEEIEKLRRWIDLGAATLRPEPESIPPGLGISPEDRSYWAYQAIPRNPALPSIPDALVGSLELPLDRWLAADLLAEDPEAATNEITSPIADRWTLLKRASFVLTGLPPDLQMRQELMEDTSDDWYERLIDRLLASPHYGEHWGRHWLDAAGYADSEGGNENDAIRPWAWRYRDWVVRSLNADMPLDQWITQQLAGDELAGPNAGDWTAQQIDLLAATGFLRMAADGTGSGTDTPEARNQTIADTLKIVGTSLLGTSLQCAQCHDHRYDPILHSDYFALRAVFAPALDWQKWKSPQARLISITTQAERQLGEQLEKEALEVAAEREKQQATAMAKALEKELLKYEEPLRQMLQEAYKTPEKDRTEAHKQLLASHPSVLISPGVLYQYLPEAAEQLKKLDEQIAAIRARKPQEQFIHALTEPAGHVPETRRFHRGDHQQPKEPVAPGGLTVLASSEHRIEFPSDDPSLPTSGRRLALARWLTAEDHPLLARVLVNRVWMHHFGEGFVATPGDFGKLGAPVEHRQVLDFLADQLHRSGWSLKQLHRTILMSRAWRQASSAESMARRKLMRLPAESMRDAMLAASGSLDRAFGGPPIAVKEDDSGQVVVEGSQTRRSLYIQVRRSRPVAMLQAFDAPVMETNCERRASSTIAPQSLMLMNGEFILEQAMRLADQVQKIPASSQAPPRPDLPPLPPTPQSHWEYGFGRWEDNFQKVDAFQKLGHWTGSQWQASAQLPDSTAGWVIWHAQGGHPDVPDRAVVRRWTAPTSGRLKLDGPLAHLSPHGDGVRGRIASSRRGLLGSWNSMNQTVETSVAEFDVEAGESIDWIVDCIQHQTSDSFHWIATLQWTPSGGPVTRIVSSEQFRGPQMEPARMQQEIDALWRTVTGDSPSDLQWQAAWSFVAKQRTLMVAKPELVPSGSTPWRQTLQQIAQALMSSNEFLYLP
ncbi:MAG: DUF1553 domain-containing protein [Pirellulaceae bacterium]